MSFNNPTIVLIGLSQKMINIITAYLSNKYHFLAINQDFNLKQLKNYTKIQLFIIDVDQVFVKVDEVVEKINQDSELKNIPKIGLSLKTHHALMKYGRRCSFEDFILMPCGNEDLLTRIDVWIKTYQSLMMPQKVEEKTYSLDIL